MKNSIKEQEGRLPGGCPLLSTTINAISVGCSGYMDELGSAEFVGNTTEYLGSHL